MKNYKRFVALCSIFVLIFTLIPTVLAGGAPTSENFTVTLETGSSNDVVNVYTSLNTEGMEAFLQDTNEWAFNGVHPSTAVMEDANNIVLTFAEPVNTAHTLTFYLSDLGEGLTDLELAVLAGPSDGNFGIWEAGSMIPQFPAFAAVITFQAPSTLTPKNANTTYTLRDADGVVVSQIDVGDTIDMGGSDGLMPRVLDASLMQLSQTPGEMWLLLFDEASVTSTPGYTIDVNWAGTTLSTGNRVMNMPGMIASYMVETPVEFPYVFKSPDSENEVAIWFPYTVNIADYVSTFPEGYVSNVDGQSVIDFGSNVSFILTFDDQHIYQEGDLFSFGDWTDLPVHSVSDFMAVQTEVGGLADSMFGSGSGCDGFCLDSYVLKYDENQIVNTIRVEFTGGPVDKAFLETVNNYKYYSDSWGDNIVIATAPEECSSDPSWAYTCVDVKVNGYPGLSPYGSYLNVKTGDEGIKNTSNETLNTNDNKFSWTYSSGSPRLLHVAGGENGSASYYTNSNNKFLYTEYSDDAGNMVWIIADSFQANTPVYYGPNQWNGVEGSVNGDGLYFTSSDRSGSPVGSLACENNECVASWIDGAYAGTYGNLSYKYSSSIYLYFGSGNTLSANNLETSSNYSITIPSGPKAGTYNPSGISVYDSDVYLSFDYNSNLGLFNGNFGADDFTLNVQGVCDDQSNCVNESVDFSDFLQSGGNAYYYNRPGELLIWSMEQTPSTSVTVLVNDGDSAEGTPAEDTGMYTILRDGDTTDPLTVYFTMSGATNGVDYNLTLGDEPVANSVVIPAVASGVNIMLTPIDDDSIEGPETATLTVNRAEGYLITTPYSADVTITDNDFPHVSITASDLYGAEIGGESEELGDPFVFTVSREGSTDQALELALSIDGTATLDTDYTCSNTSSITIPEGESSATITCTPIDDLDAEGVENVEMSIVPAEGIYEAINATATAYIVDEDGTGNDIVSVTSDNASIVENGGTTAFRFTRETQDNSVPLVIPFVIVGTATYGVDYYPISSSVVIIPSGLDSAAVFLTAMDDSDVENLETATLEIQPISGYYTVGEPSFATVAITDDDNENIDNGPAFDLSEFTYNGETHYNFDNDTITFLEENVGQFFYRTNPDVSGNTEEYLYGYGFGFFNGVYDYGYGFGYGFNYFAENADSNWAEWAENGKFGTGLGSSYGNFTLPVDDTGEITLETEIPLEGTGSLTGLEIVLPAGLVMDGGDGWNGEIIVSGAEELSSDLPTTFKDFFDSANVVTVETGGFAIGLSAAAVVKVPYENFDVIENPVVKILAADDTEYNVAECTDSQYVSDDWVTDSELLQPLNYELAINTDLLDPEQCYIYSNNFVYIATNHFTTFAAGPAATVSSGGGIFIKPIAKAKLPANTNVATKVTDFADLLTLATTSWRYPVIQKMLDLGLFKGSLVGGKLYFNMDNTMTRAMAATVIARYMGYDDTTVVTTAPFEDVATTTWYASSVAYLKAQGVVAEAAKFNPNESVTRAQFFKMLVESYMKLHPSVVTEWNASMAKESTYFADVTKANWYAGYMALAAEKGLLGGYMEGGLRYVKGTKSVSRVEAGSMLVNMLAL
jgi:hypothetical protein